ncbi:MAG TPA: tetratricopeptide repeat protein [Vicinamibacterales bacterium]|nr:tetratricopeptide repeat protein [Vicinamibacterales bacterium]
MTVISRKSAVASLSRQTTTLALLLSFFWAIPASASLTEGARLAAVYDTILHARFDEVDAELARTCPPAPAEACQSMRVVAAWWEILLNPESRRLDARFNALAASAIAASDAWTKREPNRAEAWFYLAGSYAPLVQWHVLRGERVSAAREGKKIKDALERALELDPSLNDAYFGIGLYHYYADVAPAAAKVLRFLLLLPGGDREQGLKEMLQAREHGELLRGEADYQLQIVYLWYEQQPGKAVEILEGLDARYPSNPLFLRQLAEIRDAYVHDHPASAAAWQTLLDRARAGGVYAPAQTEVRARIGLAVELDAMFETDRAIDELTKVLRAPAPAMPEGSRARAAQLLGNAQDRLGSHDLAMSAYATAVAAAPEDDPLHIREQVRAAERQKIDPRRAESYRLSLEGWRALERGAGDEAATTLEQALTLTPDDTVVRYRYARVLEARGDTVRAQAELERVIAARPVAPAIVLASAFTDCARLLERRGETARALALYRYAIAVVGGDPAAHSDAVRGVKRLAGGGGSRDF